MTSLRKPISDMTISHMVGIVEDTQHAKPTAVPSNLKASVLKTPVYYLPDDTDPFTRSVVLTVMTMHGRSRDTEVSHWKSWLISYYCIAYPELAEIALQRNPREYCAEPLPAALVESWVKVFNAVDSSDEDYYEEPIELHARFPLVDDSNLSTDLTGCNDLNGLYCYASLLLFLAGKSITAENRSAMTSKRPKAIMDEFQTYTSSHILSGEGRMSDNAHSMVNAAWTASVDPRISIITHFAAAMSVSSTPYRIMAHTMRLKMMNGMNYVNLILRFLEAFEDVLHELPQLRSDIRAFKDSAARWETIGKTIRPFFKFAYGNECTVFRRRDMPALVACGIVYAANTSDSVTNYRIDTGYAPVLNRVAEVASSHNINFARRNDQATTVTHAL